MRVLVLPRDDERGALLGARLQAVRWDVEIARQLPAGEPRWDAVVADAAHGIDAAGLGLPLVWIGADGEPGEQPANGAVHVPHAAGITAICEALTEASLPAESDLATSTNPEAPAQDEPDTPSWEELATLLEAAGPALVIDAEGQVRWANDAGHELLRAAGLASGDPLPSDPQPARGEQRISLALAGGRLGTWAVRVRVARWQGVPVRLVAARDVSEQVELEGRLRAADTLSLIGRLAAGVANDFNNLLMHVLGHVDLLQVELGDDSGASEALEAIRDSALQGSRMTRRLLTFAQGQLGRPRPIDLNHRMAKAAKWLVRRAGEGVHLEIDTEAGPLPVVADPVQVELIVENLVSNAADALNHRGRVVIRTGISLPPEGTDSFSGPQPYLQVEDDGPGMSAEQLARACEPLFTTKSEGRGMGLGLTVVEGLVRALSGHFQLESVKAHGTRATVWFRSPELPRAWVRSAPARLDTLGGRTRLVLVVDDDRTIRKLLAQALSKEGAEVLLAGDGEEGLALAIAQDRPLDLLVTDLVMPRLNGRDLADALLQRQPDLPILFVSGYPERILDSAGELGQRQAFLAKPFGIQKFLFKVRAMLTPQTEGSTLG